MTAEKSKPYSKPWPKPYLGITGPDHPAWKPELTRSGAERRLLYTRGPASDQQCRLCEKPARHWVLVRVTKSHRQEGGGSAVRQWSLDPTDYDPMCRAHRNQRCPNRPHLYPGMKGAPSAV